MLQIYYKPFERRKQLLPENGRRGGASCAQIPDLKPKPPGAGPGLFSGLVTRGEYNQIILPVNDRVMKDG
jgi:hypothetical protein